MVYNSTASTHDALLISTMSPSKISKRHKSLNCYVYSNTESCTDHNSTRYCPYISRHVIILISLKLGPSEQSIHSVKLMY